MIELTEQQQRDIARAGWPPEVANPPTGETFVLIHREMFERVRALHPGVRCNSLPAEEETQEVACRYRLDLRAEAADRIPVNPG